MIKAFSLNKSKLTSIKAHITSIKAYITSKLTKSKIIILRIVYILEIEKILNDRVSMATHNASLRSVRPNTNTSC
jgi:hypothetical protein